MTRRDILFVVCLYRIFPGCAGNSVDLPVSVVTALDEIPREIDFNRHVKPILSDKCFSCHGPDKATQKAGLRLDVSTAAYAELPETPGKKAIVPGNPGRRELVHRILSADPDYMMPDPESHLTLTDYEKAVLIRWIDEGAQYKPHWAFIKPEMPKVPSVGDKQLIKTPIDNFIVRRLEESKLMPSAPAEKDIL